MCIFQIFNIIALPLSCTKTHNVPYPILNKFIHIFVRPQYWYCSIAAPILVRAWKYVVSDENIVQRWVWFSDFIRKHMSQQKASQFSTIFSLESFLLGNYLHSYSRWSTDRFYSNRIQYKNEMSFTKVLRVYLISWNLSLSKEKCAEGK